METTKVIIVGAGPSGLALGLSLSKHGVNSVILEKASGVTEDPRGVFLAGDANRILHDLGIGGQIPEFGHMVNQVFYHKSSFTNRPFLTIPFNRNILCQTVPDAVLQSQPKLEMALRNRIKRTENCELREGCEVVGREEFDDHVVVRYKDSTDDIKLIKGSWLVGADGKRGVVRKQFLEPTAGIKQITGRFTYEGPWIVANLKLTVPTPETHPDFPLWRFGLTPTQVYDLFWPEGWHFCSPPGMPTACGRFGPKSDRLWRHEIEIDSEQQIANAEETLMGQLTLMLTRDVDGAGNRFPRPITYPKDCIEVLRCQPVMFVQKAVNKWFHNRTILIGDAAHVFPPFGGQGIACGIRDAHALAWRLLLFVRLKDMSTARAHRMLQLWALERKRGVEDCVMTTMRSGNLCRSTESCGSIALRQIFSILSLLPMMQNITQLDAIAADKGGYLSPEAGFHLSRLNGGFKVAQVLMRTSTSGVFLSDQLYSNRTSVMTLLVIGKNPPADEEKIKQAIHRVGIDPSILSMDSVRYIDLGMRPTSNPMKPVSIDMLADISLESENLRRTVPSTDHDQHLYLSRIGRSTRYAIVRPDFYVFATANSIPQLERCLWTLNQRLQ